MTKPILCLESEPFDEDVAFDDPAGDAGNEAEDDTFYWDSMIFPI